MAPVTPWPLTLWHWKASSVNELQCSQDVLQHLVCCLCFCAAGQCGGHSLATVLLQSWEEEKQYKIKKFELEVTEGTFPPQLGIPTAQFPCCFLLYDFLYVCWNSPEWAACHPRVPCVSAASDLANELGPAAECRALLMVDGAVSCWLESLWIAFSCPNFPD